MPGSGRRGGRRGEGITEERVSTREGVSVPQNEKPHKAECGEGCPHLRVSARAAGLRPRNGRNGKRYVCVTAV